MLDTVSFAELDGQHVELLPARTVMSMLNPQLSLGDANSSSGGTSPKGFSFNPMAWLGLNGNGYGAPGTDANGNPG